MRRELVMHRFRNILVAIDGDHSRQALLRRAARLAKQNGASIKLIAVVEDLPWYTRLVLPTAEELQTLIVRDKSETLERARRAAPPGRRRTSPRRSSGADATSRWSARC